MTQSRSVRSLPLLGLLALNLAGYVLIFVCVDAIVPFYSRPT